MVTSNKAWNNVKSIATTVLVTAIISSMFNFIVTVFSIDKSIIRLGDTIKVEKDKYQVGIDILTFSNYSINKVKLHVPEEVSLDDLIVNESINITEENNAVKENGTIFQIENIPENQRVHIILKLNKLVDSHKIFVDKNNNKIKVEYIDKVKSPFQGEYSTICLFSIGYGLLFGIIQIQNNNNDEKYKKKTEELEQKLKDEKDEYKEDMERLEQGHKDDGKQHKEFIERIEQERKKENNIYKEFMEEKCKELDKSKKDINMIRKHIILLLSRLNDYKSELNFWRDTVRKILYKQTNNKEDAEEVIKTVTNTLKTYQTNENFKGDFKTIEYLAKIINNDEKNN